MPVDPNIPWDLVSQVRRSDRKSQIVRRLSEDPASASELAEEMDVTTDSASNYLRDLRRMDPPVVECITPNQPHHRLYTLTEEGLEIVEHV